MIHFTKSSLIIYLLSTIKVVAFVNTSCWDHGDVVAEQCAALSKFQIHEVCDFNESPVARCCRSWNQILDTPKGSRSASTSITQAAERLSFNGSMWKVFHNTKFYIYITEQQPQLDQNLISDLYIGDGHHPVPLLKYYYYYYYFNCIQQVDHMIMVGEKSRGLSWGCGILFLQAYILYKCSLVQQAHQLKS